MKRRILFIFGLGILVVGGILFYGGVEKADSSGYTRVHGYVYCANLDPCAGASVNFEEDGNSDNQHIDITDSNGYFDLGYIETADYWAEAYCGTGLGRYAGCCCVEVAIGGCSKESYCETDQTVVLDGCLVKFYTNQSLCPGSK